MGETFTMHYRGPLTQAPEKTSNGRYTLRGVPIFECHTREDIGTVDRKWMQECIKNQQAEKARGFLPRLIVGHNSDNPDAQQKPTVGFLDNYRYDEATGWLFADYVDIEEEDLPLLKRFPGRSAEANVKKPMIDVVALLGGTPPYFRLPDVKFKHREDIAYYSLEIPVMNTDPEKIGQPSATPKSGDDEEFKKFCSYMARYEEEKAKKEKERNDDQPKKDDEKYEAQKGMLTGASSKQLAKAFGNMRADGRPPSEGDRYSDSDLTAKYSNLLSRVDELTRTNAELAAKHESAEWRAKYASAHVPAGRINIDEEVAFLMDLPEEKRQLYFDRSIRSIPSPSTKRVEKADPGSKPEPGSPEEAAAVKKYAEEKKLPFGQAQLDYIKYVRNA